ncbi:hypothetical protein MTR_0094s0140 [Medicago truncatula]|uniref:Uncharacterized protein n=1 Tax=Medicago truncatula TaxID=3880 RepID=A0A072TGV1_MEDTR|nr:hypothetical protein MTR_0094s0140 [Medicago truncatula]
MSPPALNDKAFQGMSPPALYAYAIDSTCVYLHTIQQQQRPQQICLQVQYTTRHLKEHKTGINNNNSAHSNNLAKSLKLSPTNPNLPQILITAIF